MTKKQRIGLAMLIVAVMYVTIFGSKPDLTLKVWKQVEIISGLLSGLGAYFFIYNK